MKSYNDLTYFVIIKNLLWFFIHLSDNSDESIEYIMDNTLIAGIATELL
jgi:hypothetical protein